MKHSPYGSLLLTLFLSACVTINIYFPAAEAKEAAEQIVEDILKAAPGVQPQIKVPEGPKGSRLEAAPERIWFAALLDALIPPAAAAQQPDFSVDTPEVRRIQANLKQRHGALAPYLASGAVGFTEDGLLAQRDPNAVPLRDRPRVQQLVAEDNADRNALYREIARANGHPEWEKQIRGVFAQTWIEKADAGWWYQVTGGQWRRK